jgi:hypothetical protein
LFKIIIRPSKQNMGITNWLFIFNFFAKPI